MDIRLNSSPYNRIDKYSLALVTLFVVNEIEMCLRARIKDSTDMAMLKFVKYYVQNL